MHPTELVQIRAIFEAVAPRRVLEWGTGGSTRYLLESCPFITRFVSIEHHGGWVDKVRSIVKDPRLELHHVPANVPPLNPNDKLVKQAPWMLACERDRSMMADYIDFPKTLGTRFDLVFVDGRARAFCVEVGWELLEPGGVLVVHDAQRPEYHPAIYRLGRATFLTPFHRGQVCIVKKLDQAA